MERFLRRTKKALTTDPSIVLFRARQSLRLQFLRNSGGWQRLANSARQMDATTLSTPPSLLCAEASLESDSESLRTLMSIATRVRHSQFQIFGHDAPKLESCSYSRDWVHGREWAPAYFGSYSFYENDSPRADVKFPWELSRLHYLVPVLAGELFADRANAETLRGVCDQFRRWKDANPLAHSVNWYPMEASMRLVSLAYCNDIARALAQKAGVSAGAKTRAKDLAGLLDTMICEHALFVWENRELTDVRGNHFTANLVGLLLAAQQLRRSSHPWRKWHDYSIEWLDREIDLQFCEDGVNFEKACGYHKLVLELFLLAAIVRDRCGQPFARHSLDRLRKAAIYSDAITRPDGLAANFGDTDDAVALPFDIDRPRCHGSVVALARAYFQADIGVVEAQPVDTLAAQFLLGRAVPNPPVSADSSELFHFESGGYVIVRDLARGFFFMVDVGEVGMRGRGGHGHNDILSFELFMDGRPVVTDPGCAGYTLDLEQKRVYRSTASHATVQLFGQELARLDGHWAIKNDAQPTAVKVVRRDDGVVEIEAEHNGYCRIDAGSRVRRKFLVDSRRQRVEIIDTVSTGSQPTHIEWSFPVGGNDVRVSNERECELPQCGVHLGSNVELSSTSAPYSVGYGQESVGQAVRAARISREPAQSATFFFNFEHRP